MHDETLAEPQLENEDQKESFFRRNGHFLILGAIATLPAMNLAAAIIGAKTTQKNLEIAELKLQLEKLTSSTPK
jgi:hypothetical protein